MFFLCGSDRKSKKQNAKTKNDGRTCQSGSETSSWRNNAVRVHVSVVICRFDLSRSNYNFYSFYVVLMLSVIFLAFSIEFIFNIVLAFCILCVGLHSQPFYWTVFPDSRSALARVTLAKCSSDISTGQMSRLAVLPAITAATALCWSQVHVVREGRACGSAAPGPAVFRGSQL